MNSSILSESIPIEIKSSHAAVLTKLNSDLVLQNIDMPDGIYFGQVLVKLVYSGICGAQVNEIIGTKGEDKFLPHLLGHEGIGQVIEVGPGVKNAKKGDLVVLHWRPNPGIQSETPSYKLRNEKINAGWVTTFNNYAIVSENRLTKINNRKNLPMKFLPLLGCALTTAYGCLTRETTPKSEDNIVIFGAGGVGLSLLFLANYMNLGNVTVIDVNEEKLNIAQNLNAKHIVNSSDFTDQQKLRQKIHAINDNRVDYIFETSGNVDAITNSYELGGKKTCTVLIGVPKVSEKISINTLKLHFGRKFFGTEGGKSIPTEDIPKIIDLISSDTKLIEVFPLNSFPFEEVNSALLKLRNGLAGRFILEF